MNDWKIIPPESGAAGLSLGMVKKGRMHKLNGTPCQDAIRVEHFSGGIAAVVCDGVGSLPNSHIASNATVDTVVHWFRKNHRNLERSSMSPELIRRKILREIRRSLTDAGKAYSIPMDSMDCNLAFLFVLPTQEAILGCLGDCAVCVAGASSTVLTTYSASANGTDTVLNSNAEDVMQIRTLNLAQEKVDGFLLTSDGLENELYYKNSTVLKQRAADYLNTTRENGTIRHLQSLIDALPESFDDDISLALVRCTSEPVVLENDPTWLCSCGNRNPISVTYCTNCRRDFVDLYRHTTIGNDRELFFRQLNRDSIQERKLIHAISGVELPPATPERKPEPPSAVSPAKPDAIVSKPNPTGRIEPSWDKPVTRTEPVARSSSIKSDPDRIDRSQNDPITRTPINIGSYPETDEFAAYHQRIIYTWLAGLSIAVVALFILVIILGAKLFFSVKTPATEPGSPSTDTSQTTDAPHKGRYVVDVRHLDIYEAPVENSSSTGLIVRINRNDIVEVLSDPITTGNYDWVEIRTEDGTIGWCRFNSLTPYIEAPETTAPNATSPEEEEQETNESSD